MRKTTESLKRNLCLECKVYNEKSKECEMKKVASGKGKVGFFERRNCIWFRPIEVKPTEKD